VLGLIVGGKARDGRKKKKKTRGFGGRIIKSEIDIVGNAGQTIFLPGLLAAKVPCGRWQPLEAP